MGVDRPAQKGALASRLRHDLEDAHAESGIDLGPRAPARGARWSAEGYTDQVLDDEVPLSMFFEALEKKMRTVIESTAGITGSAVD